MFIKNTIIEKTAFVFGQPIAESIFPIGILNMIPPTTPMEKINIKEGCPLYCSPKTFISQPDEK